MSDDRQEVRLACTEALCDAISDRYCAVVPTGILIDVLAHVLVPVIRLLGDILIIDWHREALSASHALPSLLSIPFSASSSPSSSLARADRNALNASSEAAANSKKLVERDIKDWVNVEVSDRAPRPNTMEVCVDKLCHIFSAHLHKLVSYPSFDKLWLQVLHLFGYFIGSSQSPEPTLAASLLSDPASDLPSDQAEALKDISSKVFAQLKMLLRMMQKEDVFIGKPALLAVTRDYLQQVQGCEALADTIAALDD